MKILAKIKWVASILLVCLIVLITNIIDRKNFNRLSYAVTTMYEDRIVASDLLFEMSILIKEKHIAVLTSDTIFFKNQNDTHYRELNRLVAKYKLTKLTEKENLAFSHLQEELASLTQEEIRLHMS